jgi:hypothetical protein
MVCYAQSREPQSEQQARMSTERMDVRAFNDAPGNAPLDAPLDPSTDAPINTSIGPYGLADTPAERGNRLGASLLQNLWSDQKTIWEPGPLALG